MTAAVRLAAAVVAVAAVAVGGAVWHPVHHGRPELRGRVEPVQARTLVCPNVTGIAGALTTTMTVANPTKPQAVLGYSPLTGAAHPAQHAVTAQPASTLTVTQPYASVAVSATGVGAAALLADQVALAPAGIGRAFTDAACTAPAADWWFAGADGRIGATDTLFLANPSDSAANVSLSLWSAAGPLSPPGAAGIVVPPHSAWRRNIADLAPDAAGIAVHVHADSGTVSAALYDRRYSGVSPAGGDWIPATLPPSRALVVPGYAPYAGPKGLALANPGGRDASVSLRVATAHGNFAPSGSQSVVVPAGRTVSLDLGAALGTDPAGVLVTSDQPVTAAGVSVARVPGRFSDLAWQAAQLPLTGPAGIAMTVPPFGQQSLLVVTAPRDAARLRVASADGASTVVAVPAGRSVSVDLRTALRTGPLGPGPISLTPEGAAPVYAVRILYALGSHGPLIASEPPTGFPAAVSLPGVAQDLRVADQSSSP